MIKHSLSILSVLLLAHFATSQYHKKYDWEKSPTFQSPTIDALDKSTTGLKLTEIVEYVSKGNTLKLYVTKHELLHLHDEKGIRQNNKVYIPMGNVNRIVDIKARTITSNGTIKNFNKNNIKEIQNVEEYGNFKIFALEGVEVNANVEIMYTLEKNYYPFGWITLQQNYPIQEADFILIHGYNNARAKVYGTFKTIEELKVSQRNSKVLSLTNIPAMEEEDFATPKSNKISVAYQCFHQGRTVTNRMVWQNVVNNVCKNAFVPVASNKVSKEVKKELPNSESLGTFEKANWLDHHIKTTYNVIKSNDPKLDEINNILKNRKASPSGILMVYGHYLTELNIDYEIVLTANRYLHNFDPEFFTPRALQNFLIFIPSIKKYIATDRIDYRLGEAPFNTLGNKGLFVNKSLGFRSGKIKQEDSDYSRIKRVTEINFDKDVEKAFIYKNDEYYGHWAVSNRAAMQFSSEADIEGFKDYLLGSGIDDKQTLQFKVTNDEIYQPSYNEAFIVESEVSSESMIEDAGDSYLFLVGKVIGTQSELYQEKERMNPILTRYPNTYNYTITVNIPEGFKADGLEGLKIYKELKIQQETACKFESSYKLDGNKLIISIEEFYKRLEIPVEYYDQYRKVINAASDFNKASILIAEEA